ncbi:hypothetical protein LCGC14_1865470 [marine sediment metagenome]|uniref:Probable zinc-binding domain-containing protein n=1 Tax=marine sediment metagenome TaxID=412755 RepID=A0A0F9IKQ8_9ZZZZ
MPDKLLKCGDCGEMFTWSEREQEFYKEKDFTPPKRCKPCREKRKKDRANRGGNRNGNRPPKSGNRR